MAKRSWLRGLLMLPAATLPLLPAFSCPICLAAYTGALSALGLGVLFRANVQLPLILVFLALGVGSVAWSTRSHGRRGPLVLSVLGAAGVIAGRIVWSIPLVLYAAVGLLVVASLWNLWVKKPAPELLVQITFKGEES